MRKQRCNKENTDLHCTVLHRLRLQRSPSTRQAIAGESYDEKNNIFAAYGTFARWCTRSDARSLGDPVNTSRRTGACKGAGRRQTLGLPRTPDGQPDLQGNWSNETQTPLERMGNQGPTLTDEQAAALETRAQDVEEFRDRPTDPGRQRRRAAAAS